MKALCRLGFAPGANGAPPDTGFELVRTGENTYGIRLLGGNGGLKLKSGKVFKSRSYTLRLELWPKGTYNPEVAYDKEGRFMPVLPRAASGSLVCAGQEKSP